MNVYCDRRSLLAKRLHEGLFSHFKLENFYIFDSDLHFIRVLSFLLFISGHIFNTCKNTGPTGPTQYQCDSAYSEVQVNVLDNEKHPFLKGTQVWKVPVTDLYR